MKHIDPTVEYDVVELPSKGIFYENKKSTVRVAYLTASDENILASPNFTRTNQIMDELLKRKVLDDDIKVEDIVDEDRQAILMFLRNTAFGTEYKVVLTDPVTNKTFEHTVDLSEVKYKEFTLKMNSEGEYPFTTDGGKLITFKFLNKKQEDELIKIETEWTGTGVPPIVTKRLEMMIKSVDGERDPMKLYNYINSMRIKDSQDLRKYVNDNKPGIDLKRKVIAPSNEEIQFIIGFGVEFFRPFYGL